MGGRTDLGAVKNKTPLLLEGIKNPDTLVF
jgi:hypothetical protein